MVETGSELVSELWSSKARASASILAYPEGRAALAAAHRHGRLTAAAHASAIDELESLLTEVHLLGVDRDLTRHAGRLADELALRGYDAVHLASALAIDAETMVTWDTDLRAAALSSGLAVARTG